MDKEKLMEVVSSSSYDFLRTNPHLSGKIIFLTLGGSYAYGTNVEGSDIDVRGCALNSMTDLVGLTNFEQVVDETTDTTIYSFNKLLRLLISCNPNTIELLGCKPESYAMVTKEGQLLLDNKELFLSKRAIYAFGGYANSQLRRLQNALAHDRYPQDEKEKHILGTCKTVMDDFRFHYGNVPEGSVRLFIDKSVTEGMETEIFTDVNLTHYPLRNFKAMVSELGNVISLYAKLGKRNTKKDDLHLNKHAMHLVRLYLMCFDILEKGEINTYRPDKDFLLEIRNGKFQRENGTFDSSFFDLINEYEKRLEYDKENTSLPEKPDINKIQELTVEVNRSIVLNRG